MDYGFTKVFTPAILKFAYFLALPGLLLAWAVLTVVGFQFGALVGLAALVIVGPGIVIGGMLTIRVVFELILLGIKAADDMHALRVSQLGG